MKEPADTTETARPWRDDKQRTTRQQKQKHPQSVIRTTMSNSTPSTNDPKKDESSSSRIQALPKEVVDRIAAGEVVQRPASVVKELLENSLDANSTSIDVQCTGGGMRLLTITDDGDGIYPADLPLAATRFATSKLKKLDDLKSIATFGFRGEALASASMVGRLCIISRKRKRPDTNGSGSRVPTACAYKMSYCDGKPTKSKPSPSAGKEGTVVKLEDLFYNLPSRKRAFEGSRKENEEYLKILSIAQRYAVHKAKDGVGFVCRKRGGGTDLNTANINSIKKLKLWKKNRHNTSVGKENDEKKEDVNNNCDDSTFKRLQEQATKDVISHIYGCKTARELLTLECGRGDVDGVSMAALRAMREHDDDGDCKLIDDDRNTLDVQKSKNFISDSNSLLDGLVLGRSDYGAMIAKESEKNSASPTSSDNAQFTFAYKAHGLITNGSYCVPKSSSAFLLFINGRLVESAPLKRAMESVYQDTLPKGAKPFIYLSLELPGPHLDVNVHPTKREVAFLHEDRLYDALANATRDLLRCTGTSRTFYTQTLISTDNLNGKEKKKIIGNVVESEEKMSMQKKTRVEEQNQEDKSDSIESSNSNGKSSHSQSDNSGMPNNDGSESKKRSLSSKEIHDDHTPHLSQAKKKKKGYDPKNLVRTDAGTQQGALEPFLVPTQLSQQTQSSQEDDSGPVLSNTSGSFIQRHAPGCEFASLNNTMIDMSVPGAFASICRCQVERSDSLPLKTFTPIVKPKKIIPTKCSYESIKALRSDIPSRANSELTTKLRDAVFVGCINRHRSLIQSGIELLMINHYELSKELFYQLAVLRFGGFQMASLGKEGVNVKVLIEQALQFEDSVKSFVPIGHKNQYGTELTVDETNSEIAAQATACLRENAEMLVEYFSIRLEVRTDPSSNDKKGADNGGVLMLTGLPILLEGHSPSPHALPGFLMRLATEVDFEEERPCFEGICTELGAYFAEIPWPDAELNNGESNENSNKKPIELIDNAGKKFVQHTLFPALRFLLVLPKDFGNDGSFSKLAMLSKLYKVFERC